MLNNPTRGRNVIPRPPAGKDAMARWDNGWYITINTNTNLPGLKNALNTVWKYVVTHGTEFLYGRPGAQLLELKSNHNVEIGKAKHKIHVHGTIVATTTGIAMLDYDKIMEFFNRNLRQIPGFKRINFQSKLIKDPYSRNYPLKTDLERINYYVNKEKKEDSDEEVEFQII